MVPILKELPRSVCNCQHYHWNKSVPVFNMALYWAIARQPI